MSNPYAPPSPDRAPDDREGHDRAGDDRAGTDRAGDDRRPQDLPRPPVPQHPRPPQPPHPHPHPSGPQDPPDPEAQARVGRLVRHFGIWLVAGVVVSLLPAPWQLATVPFLVGAVVAGVRALHAAGTARLRGGLLPLLTAGLVMTGILLVGTLGSVVTLPLDLERQQCLGSALTRSAQATCERAYSDGLEGLTGGLLGGSTAP